MILQLAQEAAHNGLLLAHAAPPRIVEARAWTAHALHLAPVSWSVWNNAGVVEEHLGATARAVLTYRHAADLAPTKPEPHRNLGALARRARLPRAAAEAYARAMQLQPGDSDGWLQLADALVHQREDLAQAAFRRGILLYGWPALTTMKFLGGRDRMQRLLDQERQQLTEMAVPEPLTRFIKQARRLENATAWAQARWLNCARSTFHFEEATETASCDDYGAHFFTPGSFLGLLKGKALSSVASAWASRSNHDRGLAQRAIVLGSGLGEQCAFILAAWPSITSECWGYERGCAALAHLASGLAAKVKAAGPSWPTLRFVCGDATVADLRGAWLLVVNNNGWPDSVTEVILRSAVAQMPSGSALALHRWPGDLRTVTEFGKAFVKAGQVAMETSWRDDAPVVIYVRQ